MSLVDLYNRTKDYQQVINTLNRLEERDGKSEAISMEKFRMYLAMDNDEQAFTEIENLAKEYPYDMRYLTILGDVYMNNGKEEEAYSIFQKVLKENRDMLLPCCLWLLITRRREKTVCIRLSWTLYC